VVFLCNRSMIESNPPLLSQVKTWYSLLRRKRNITVSLFSGVLLEAEDDRKVLISSLVSKGIIEDEEMDNDVVVNASGETLFSAKWCYMISTTLQVRFQPVLLDSVTSSPNSRKRCVNMCLHPFILYLACFCKLKCWFQHLMVLNTWTEACLFFCN